MQKRKFGGLQLDLFSLFLNNYTPQFNARLGVKYLRPHPIFLGIHALIKQDNTSPDYENKKHEGTDCTD